VFVSDASLRRIMQAASDAVVSMDQDGRVIDWNAGAEQMFGLTRDEVAGMLLDETIIPLSYRAAHREGLRRFLDTGDTAIIGRTVALTACRRDGSEFPVRLTVSAQAHDEGWVFDALVSEVSERAGLPAQLESVLGAQQPGIAEILDVLGEAVTIRDREDRIIYANRAALEHMGFASLADMQARPAGSIMGDYIVRGEDGRELSMDDIPSVRLLRGEAAEPLLIRTVHRVSGELHWNVLKATALRDAAGEVAATVMIIEDVTAVKTAELRSRFLSETSRVLGSSLDYEQTLRSVAWAAVPQIADWCGVDLVDEHGVRERVVAAHPDPAKLVLAERLHGYEPAELDLQQGLGKVVRTGEPELFNDISDEVLVAVAVDAEHLALLRELALRSVIIVPIRGPTRTLGAMSLVGSESGRRFSTDDVRFAEQLADRAGAAIENARLYRARTQVALTLQRSLLPEVIPTIPGWQIAALYRPAGAEMQLEVGGDFYDFMQTDDGWIVVIGDVTGKGVQAAALTSLVRHGARFVAQMDARPSAILHHLDTALKQRSTLSLCTALCARLHPEHVLLSSAGHPLPLIIATDGSVRQAGTTHALLGMPNALAWRDELVTVEPGATIVLYTDGVTDTRGSDGRYGEARLRRLLATHATSPPDQLLGALEAELRAFQIGIQSDDTAIIALRAQPESAPEDPQTTRARPADQRAARCDLAAHP
jgi:PAS domain S-box-containing protein